MQVVHQGTILLHMTVAKVLGNLRRGEVQARMDLDGMTGMELLNQGTIPVFEQTGIRGGTLIPVIGRVGRQL